MKLTFVSNYINHHQIPVSNVLFHELGENYRFIQTEPMEEERVKMGWAAALVNCPYLLNYYDQEEECQDLIDNSDIVIFGGVDDETYITKRLEDKKIVIRYSERIYKDGQWKAISPRGLVKKYRDHTRHRKGKVYLLCAGAYVASDFHIIRAYQDKRFQWGYFPEVREYPIKALIEGKQKAIVHILWAGRMIDWKHPEYPIQLAKRLKVEGITFHLKMIGSGPLEETIRADIKTYQLEKQVTLMGFVPPEIVRAEMEAANIYLFTSDYREGWGAVLNEAMNSGCAVVSNLLIGASLSLIEDGKNGYLYPNKDFEKFYSLTKELILNRKKQKEFGTEAYQTIYQLWNSKIAGKRLLSLCKQIISGKISYAKKGPLSKAEIISPKNRRIESDKRFNT